MVGGGWGATFWFLKSLDNNMLYSSGVMTLGRTLVRILGFKHYLFQKKKVPFLLKKGT